MDRVRRTEALQGLVAPSRHGDKRSSTDAAIATHIMRTTKLALSSKKFTIASGCTRHWRTNRLPSSKPTCIRRVLYQPQAAHSLRRYGGALASGLLRRSKPPIQDLSCRKTDPDPNLYLIYVSHRGVQSRLETAIVGNSKIDGCRSGRTAGCASLPAPSPHHSLCSAAR
jgi:hypothetical protein